MPRLNRRVFLRSIVIFFSLAVALGSIHRLQRGQQTALYASQAALAAKDGDLTEAIKGYKKALLVGGERSNWLAELATLYESSENIEQCYLVSQRLERLDPDKSENRRRLAECALKLERYQDAIDWIESMERSGSNLSAPLQVMKADACVGRRENDKAANLYRQAIASGIDDPNVDVRLATLLDRQLKETESARRVLDEMVERLSTTEAVLLRGKFYFEKAGGLRLDSVDQSTRMSTWINGATSDATIARRLSNDSAESLQFAAAVLLFQGRDSEAIAVAKQGIETQPGAPSFYRLGSLAAERAAAKAGNSDSKQRQLASELRTQGDAFLDLGLQRLPDSTELLWQKATCLLDRNAAGSEAFSEVMESLSRNQFSPALVQFLQARRLAADSKIAQAIAQLKSVRVEVIQDAPIVRLVDLSLADCYRKVGNNDDRIATLRRIVTESPNWLPIRERLAGALLDAGRIEDAIREYQTIAAQPDVPIEAPLNFARLLLIQNLNRTEAERDWRPLESLLDALFDHAGVRPEVAVLKAEVMLARGQPDSARRILQNAAQTEPVQSATAMLAISQGDFEFADATIRTAVEERGLSPKLKHATVSLAIQRGLGSDAEPERSLDQIDTGFESEWDTSQCISYSELMIPLLMQHDQVSKVHDLVDYQLGVQPANIKTQSRKLQLAYQSGDQDELTRYVDHLESTSGDAVLIHYGRALQTFVQAANDEELAEEDYNAAQASLAAAAALRPDSASIVALSAQLSDRAGRHEVAIGKYKQAISLGQRDLTMVRRLVSLLSDAGRFSEADAVMRALRQSNRPFSAELSRVASEISVQLSQVDRAINLAQRAAEKSNHEADYLWLARVCQLGGETPSAETAYRNAIRTAPHSAEAWLAWIAFLNTESRLDEARQALEEFESSIEQDDESGKIAVAQGYALLRDAAGTRRLLHQIDASELSTIKQHGSYLELVTATGGDSSGEEHLRRTLSETKSESPQRGLFASSESAEESNEDHRFEMQRWARRQLALTLSRESANKDVGPGTSMNEAVSLLEENLHELPDNVDDRYALAIVQSRFLGVANPSVPLKTFDSLRLDGWKPNASDQFLIGRLHAANGDWSKARDLMLPLLGDKGFCRPKHIKRYARLLLDRDNHAEASLWIDRLQEERVLDPETAALVCELQFCRGDLDQVLSNLSDSEGASGQKSWLHDTLSTKQRFEMLVKLSTKLNLSEQTEEASRFEKASVALAKALSTDGDFPAMFYLRELIRRGNTAEAIAALSEQMARASSGDLVRFAETLLTESSCTADDLAVVEKLFVARAKSHPADTPIRIAIARMRESRGDEQTAIRIYSSILSDGKRDMAAENNLAALHALTGNPEKGIELCNRAIDEFGERMFLLDTRGLCHLQANRLSEAVTDFKRAYAIVPHPVVLFHIAWAEDLRDQPTASRHAFSLATAQGLLRSKVHLLERDHFDRLLAGLRGS